MITTSSPNSLPPSLERVFLVIQIPLRITTITASPTVLSLHIQAATATPSVPIIKTRLPIAIGWEDAALSGNRGVVHDYNHYFCSSSPYTNKIAAPCGISVIQPDGSIMQSSHTALMDAPHLPLAVRKGHIFPIMKNKALLSLGQFYDNGYEVALKNPPSTLSTSITLPFLSMVPGILPTACGLWTFPSMLSSHLIHSSTAPQVNNVYELNKNRDIVTYLHKAAYNPVPSTWIEIIEAEFFST